MKKNLLIQLFRDKFGKDPDSVVLLPDSGSHRRYFRLSKGNHNAIGAFNSDKKENDAFFSFAQVFLGAKLKVPRIYSVHTDKQHYLIEDLGKTHLFDLVKKKGFTGSDGSEVTEYYKKALSSLINFQIEGNKKLNYKLCIPRDSFDKQSVLWDLNHFKYFFVKISGLPFDEQQLEKDFQLLADELDKVDRNYFMYRDFQSRNIMIHKDTCYFIDFQGGRKGALQYDLASLLFEAKTNLPFSLRTQLLEYYLRKLKKHLPIDREKFIKDYYKFALIRILQAMGAYGLRGWVEKKSLFLQSIPFAINNIEWLLENNHVSDSYPELKRLLYVFTLEKKFKYRIPSEPETIRVEINSFSYRKTPPADLTGNGGGFVFDCRFLHNPGRYPDLKDFTGLDPDIDTFFKERSKMQEFLDYTFTIVSQAVSGHKEKGYKYLQVNFGCTGGRHRSVYAAEQIAGKLRKHTNCEVIVCHTESDNW